MRTRCKFHCVGVEDTEHRIGTEPVPITKEEYDALEDKRNTRIEYPRSLGGGYAQHFRIEWQGKFAQNVRLVAQYDPTKSEDVSFAEATPSGELKIYVSNPVVVGTFKPGNDYYLDLIPCES